MTASGGGQRQGRGARVQPPAVGQHRLRPGGQLLRDARGGQRGHARGGLLGPGRGGDHVRPAGQLPGVPPRQARLVAVPGRRGQPGQPGRGGQAQPQAQVAAGRVGLDQQPALGLPRAARASAVVVTPGEAFSEASAISGIRPSPARRDRRQGDLPGRAAAATCGIGVLRHLQLHHRLPAAARCRGGLTDSTTAWPTGSAARALPAPAAAGGPGAGVASTSTFCPAARSGGNWPGLTATPSRPGP